MLLNRSWSWIANKLRVAKAPFSDRIKLNNGARNFNETEEQWTPKTSMKLENRLKVTGRSSNKQKVWIEETDCLCCSIENLQTNYLTFPNFLYNKGWCVLKRNNIWYLLFKSSEKQKGLKRETLNNGGKSEYTWWKSSKEENLKTLYRIYFWRIKVV